MKILCPFDGSPAALRAVELLAGYAGETGRLTPALLNVQARPVAFWPQGGLDPVAVDAALIEAGQRTLAPALERLPGASGAVRLGFAADMIRRETLASGAELIVMGTRGSGPLRGFALGSVALRVAQSGVAPTLLVKPDSRLPAGMGRNLRVLLGVDGSEQANRAASRLAAWSRWLGNLRVELAYVHEDLPLIAALLPPHGDVMAQWSDAAGNAAAETPLQTLARAGVPHHLHRSVGDPPAELAQLAEDASCDLLALGTRGLGAVHHAFVGSVALKAAALSRVPVLLVP